MSATDPLREALAELTEAVAHIATNPRHTHPGRPCVSYEHLPVATHERLWTAIIAAREALAAVLVEPEVWEWRVEHNVGIGGHLGPTTEAAWCRLRVDELIELGYEAHLEIRRAPGSWERVDPEQEGGGT